MKKECKNCGESNPCIVVNCWPSIGRAFGWTPRKDGSERRDDLPGEYAAEVAAGRGPSNNYII
jgi:hypothetical protein